MTLEKKLWSVLGILSSLALAGCSEPSVTGNPTLVNPTDVSGEVGSTEELEQVCQEAITSLFNERPPSPDTRPERIVLDRIVNNTGDPDYDQQILYNKLLAQLTQAARGRYLFVNRRAVQAEREAQESGAVTNVGVQGAPSGADLVLTIELRTLRGAGTTTIQYYFELTELDGTVAWANTTLFKKRT